MRLFSSLGLVVAPPACEPGQDTAAVTSHVLTTWHWAATAFGGALTKATGLASYLSGCLSPAVQRCPFEHRRRLEAFHAACRAVVVFPTLALRLSAFRRFSLGGIKSLNPPESPAPCWCAVTTVCPPGNCDSLRLETCLGYLTRLGAVSHRPSPPSPCFASLTRANVPEGLVNPAFVRPTFRSGYKGAGPTSLAQPFPGHPGVS